MRTRRTTFALIVAVLCLAAASSTAFANRAIGVNPGGAVVKSTAPGMPMLITDSNGVVIACEVTYNETWETRIVKVQNTTVAAVMNGIAEGCVGGNGIVEVEAVILQLGMASPKLYQSYRGILPNIESLLFIVNPLRILIRYKEVVMPTNTIGCLYQGPVGFDTGGGPNKITKLIIQPNQFVPLSLQLFGVMPCPVNIKVAGTFGIAPALNLILLNQ